MDPEVFKKWMEEWKRISDADHKENMERIDREREADDQKHKENMERLKREREADHQEHLKRMEEIDNGPPIPYPITSCTIPSPPIQEVTSLHIFPSFPIV